MQTLLGLGDGSIVHLGHESEIRLLSQQDGRCIELKGGSMACEVKPQPRDKPLVFASPQADVTVLGTAFNMTVAPASTSVRVSHGHVRLSAGGRSVDLHDGDFASAYPQGVTVWSEVCQVDFAAIKALPPQFETVYCDSQSLHTPSRRIVPAADSARLVEGGLEFVDTQGKAVGQGLLVLRWTGEIGDDLAMEAEVSAGPRWSLGFALDGDSFDGYRVIFAAPSYPYGITIDSIYPAALTLLAQDPRPIPFEHDHTLRVEKVGRRFRVWVDGEIRIDTEVNHPLGKERQRTFAISNFGASPLIRSLRVWKAIPPSSSKATATIGEF